MKTFVSIVLAAFALCAMAADEDIIVGTITSGANEVKLYDLRGACLDPNYLGASKYPIGDKTDFVMGCWRPMNDLMIEVRYDNGQVERLPRAALRLSKKYAQSRFSL